MTATTFLSSFLIGFEIFRFHTRIGSKSIAAVVAKVETNDFVQGISTKPSLPIKGKKEGEHDDKRPTDNEKNSYYLGTKKRSISTAATPRIEPAQSTIKRMKM
jgi:hypothetical protein